MAKTKAASAKSKQGKHSKAQTKQLITAIICLAIILAIALGAFYLFAPDSFMKAWNSIFNPKPPISYLEGDILEIRFVDVGQGDCIIIRFPDGKNMIIDAGGTKNGIGIDAKDALLSEIKDLGITTFDYMMATHSDQDHVDYLGDVLKATEVKTVYRPSFLAKSEPNDNKTGIVDTNTYNEFIVAAKSEPDCNVINNEGRLEIKGEGYSMDIYAPPAEEYTTSRVGKDIDAKEKNRVSPICFLNYGGRSAVFTGDAEGKGGNGAEDDFIENNNFMPKDCDILKVGHHGSETSSSNRFLNHIDVEYAVISVGLGNTYKHPRSELLDRLGSYRDNNPDGDEIGIKRVYRTDLDGAVSVQIGANGGMKWSIA